MHSFKVHKKVPDASRTRDFDSLIDEVQSVLEHGCL